MKTLTRTHIHPTYHIGLPHPIYPPALPQAAKRRIGFNGVSGIKEEIEHKRHENESRFIPMGEVCEPLN